MSQYNTLLLFWRRGSCGWRWQVVLGFYDEISRKYPQSDFLVFQYNFWLWPLQTMRSRFRERCRRFWTIVFRWHNLRAHGFFGGGKSSFALISLFTIPFSNTPRLPRMISRRGGWGWGCAGLGCGWGWGCAGLGCGWGWGCPGLGCGCGWGCPGLGCGCGWGCPGLGCGCGWGCPGLGCGCGWARAAGSG